MTESELANNLAWLHVGHRYSSSKMKANITMLHSEIGNCVNIAATQLFPSLRLSESVFQISTQS